ncbi:acyl-CoA dehydrogenase family protein [Subtercola lobariae]|uniref:Acyl-CoA dehydrogenase n=1 Tax=Subtercola lobariae TaxID=1588641 RepID=A0A917F1Z8_9MICO|nr:acyl-CoA dehydrogenase family protein [Subtercola lobariae]GGF42126.1 acyl-CoA dehydrogenase [Subtercola lobariae]
MTVTVQPLTTLVELRARTRQLCSAFDDAYWRETDRNRRYPQEFVDALTESGLLAALVPAEYGGMGLGITEGSVILEEINHSGGHSAACHAQMYTMGSLLRHGSEEQKSLYLPAIAAGDLRLQAFSITEDAGSDTTNIETRAETVGDDFIVTGHKTWTSRVEESDLMLLLARTTAKSEVKTDGMTLFLVDLRQVRAEQPESMRVVKVNTMMNYATNQIFYEGMRLPKSSVIGEVGSGFRYVLDSWNAERILLAAEAVGDGYWFTERASTYAGTRVVFDRQIGVNQGVQFPITEAYMKVRSADLMRFEAARLFDQDEPCGPEANMAKYLSSEASWEAANACLNTYGGYGFVDEYDIERKFRETRMYQVAPINNNLIKTFIGSKVLGMPRTY